MIAKQKQDRILYFDPFSSLSERIALIKKAGNIKPNIVRIMIAKAIMLMPSHNLFLTMLNINTVHIAIIKRLTCAESGIGKYPVWNTDRIKQRVNFTRTLKYP